MTSKKKLQFIRDTYEFYFNRSKPFRDTELTEQEKEAFDSIEKDLEILDIIRKKITYHINPFGNGYIGYVITDDVEEFDLIKEWLNNGKD